MLSRRFLDCFGNAIENLDPFGDTNPAFEGGVGGAAQGQP